MAYSVRSLATLAAQARQYFTQSIPGAIASVWANTFTIEGKVLALLDFEHEQRRAWLFKQQFASTADEVWLRRHGFELNITQSPAAVAVGTITVAAMPTTVVPSGLTFIRPDGLTFTTISGEVASGNSVTLYIEADLTGAAGNTDPGTTFTLDAGDKLDGLGTVGTVDTDGLSGGTDLEPLESFRARILARKRKPPQGGAAPDYVEWAREALSTVQDVWVDSFTNDARAVWIAFTVADQANGIPTADQVAVVQAYLDDPIRRPVTARVFVMLLSPYVVDVTIGALSPDTPDIRNAVQVELAAEFTDRAQAGTPSAPFTFWRSWIDEAISRATGEDSHDLVAPADTTVSALFLPVLGTVTFT